MGIATGIFFYLRPHAPPTDAAVVAPAIEPDAPQVSPSAAASTGVVPPSPIPSPSPSHYPVIEEKIKLPTLDESDEAVIVALKKLLGTIKLDLVFEVQDFIRKTVITIDSASRKEIRKESSPFKQATGKFLVDSRDGNEYLSPKNYKRYAPFIEVLRKVDEQELVGVYLRFYPLFQLAFKDLGTGGYFNDRLVEIIDLLLATPVPEEAPQVFTPAIYYRYSDPKLEALSSGQKILLRIGPENEKLLQTKLKNIRKLLSDE